MNVKLPFIEVIWKDAWVKAEDPVSLDDVKDSHKPTIIHTIGWVLLEDDEGLSIANEHYDDDDTFRGRTFIPKGMIVDRIPFKLSRPRSPKIKSDN